jgi:hypothetical protein
MTASVSACSAVDDVETSTPPNCGKTPSGILIGWLTAPAAPAWSIVP